MKLIFNNPYRVIGVLANASAKEIQSRKGKISAYARVGKKVDSDYDFFFLPNLDRTPQNIDSAITEIQQAEGIVENSLFWFIKVNPSDETAINYLINGNQDKAIEIWEKLTKGKEITSKNFRITFSAMSSAFLDFCRIY